MRYLAVILIAALLVGCAPQSVWTTDDGMGQAVNLTGSLRRIVDCEAGVVLYRYAAPYAGGLATVPIVDTMLDYDDVCGSSRRRE